MIYLNALAIIIIIIGYAAAFRALAHAEKAATKAELQEPKPGPLRVDTALATLRGWRGDDAATGTDLSPARGAIGLHVLTDLVRKDVTWSPQRRTEYYPDVLKKIVDVYWDSDVPKLAPSQELTSVEPSEFRKRALN